MIESIDQREGGGTPDEVPAAPVITVAVCSFNGAERIGAALKALNQQVHSTPFEVIVVDDGSSDDTAAIAAQAGATVIRLDENLGRGSALQQATKRARGVILAMVDDDCVPSPDWVQRLADEWRQAPREVTVIGGSVRPLAVDSFNRRYVEFREPLRALELEGDRNPGFASRLRRALLPCPHGTGRRAVRSTAGANMSVRLSALREVGGFDPKIHFGGEEEEVCRRLQDAHGPETVQFVPDMEMPHDFRPNLGDSLRRARAYGRSHGERYAREGGIPTVQPIPLLIAGLLAPLFAWRFKLGTFALALLPLLLYRGWFRRCQETSTAEPMLYPYVRLIEDLAGELGFVEGLLAKIRSG